MELLLSFIEGNCFWNASKVIIKNNGSLRQTGNAVVAVNIIAKVILSGINFFSFNSHKPVFWCCVFMHPKAHKPKNWLYDACLDKAFPSSTNASPILIQLSLFYLPLNSHSDDSFHRSLQGKSPSLAGFKSFIFISLPCFSLNRAITWPSFLLQTYACCHLIPHMILHLMVYFVLHNK